VALTMIELAALTLGVMMGFVSAWDLPLHVKVLTAGTALLTLLSFSTLPFSLALPMSIAQTISIIVWGACFSHYVVEVKRTQETQDR
jgi:hypothetical protein